MSWFRHPLRHLLHLDDGPDVTDDDRAELAHLRDVTAQASERATEQASEAHRLARYFRDQNERNHIAERLGLAMRSQRGR